MYIKQLLTIPMNIFDRNYKNEIQIVIRKVTWNLSCKGKIQIEFFVTLDGNVP